MKILTLMGDCSVSIIILVFTSFFNFSLAQSENGIIPKPPGDWFLLDSEINNIQGLSIEKTYQTLLKNQPSQTVLVAVIDSGVDIDHEDLKRIVWVNQDEIPNNGIDDDKNGYIDDVNGWSFICGINGNVNEDTYEVTRELVRLNKKFEQTNPQKLNKKEKSEYAYFQTVKERYEEQKRKDELQYKLFNRVYSNLVFSLDTLKVYFKSDSISAKKLEGLESNDPVLLFAKSVVLSFLRNQGGASFSESFEELKEGYDYYTRLVKFSLNKDFDPRGVVGDNYSNKQERIYGCNDVKGPDSDHGTHVAGIIAADRLNNLGVKGVAENVRIMPVRVVPNGDERDKDVANAIFYAVDNGAQIINMSFGKEISPDKAVVDAAVKYAEKKGVLIIHAAGNDSQNTDEIINYPSRFYQDGKEAGNWIEVGALSYEQGEGFVARFSNYGRKSVDLFSPGVDIYSAAPGNKYKSHSGTSQASPTVAGLAAIIMSYFPEFNATEVKSIIVQSTRKFENLKVLEPGKDTLANFSQLSISGGVVNAYQAVMIALEKREEKKAIR